STRRRTRSTLRCAGASSSGGPSRSAPTCGSAAAPSSCPACASAPARSSAPAASSRATSPTQSSPPAIPAASSARSPTARRRADGLALAADAERVGDARDVVEEGGDERDLQDAAIVEAGVGAQPLGVVAGHARRRQRQLLRVLEDGAV